MTLKQLEAFYLAATLGNFALAAERAHVTQSSLSKRIAELEVWMGTLLFDRSGNRAQLTDAGHRLIPVAARMLELRQTARSSLSAAPTLSGTCRFGISELGALTWLPDLVNAVRSTHPNLVLQPHVDLGRRLERQVVRGELDFAVIPGPAEDPRIDSALVGEVQFSWMAAPGRIDDQRILTANELAAHPVITMTEGSGVTQAFDRWASTQGLKMQRMVTSNSLMAIIGLTIADVGLSFLPEAFVHPWLAAGTLQAFRSDPPLPTMPYCFMRRSDDGRAMLPLLQQQVEAVAQFSRAAGFSRK